MDKFPITENRFMRDGVQINRDRRIISAQFGDGYEQVVEDGINTDISTYALTWTDVPQEPGDTIYSFLEQHLKTEPFLFVLPKTTEEIPVRCIALSKRLYNLTSTYRSITCTLKRTAAIS